MKKGGKEDERKTGEEKERKRGREEKRKRGKRRDKILMATRDVKIKENPLV